MLQFIGGILSGLILLIVMKLLGLGDYFFKRKVENRKTNEVLELYNKLESIGNSTVRKYFAEIYIKSELPALFEAINSSDSSLDQSTEVKKAFTELLSHVTLRFAYSSSREYTYLNLLKDDFVEYTSESLYMKNIEHASGGFHISYSLLKRLVCMGAENVDLTDIEHNFKRIPMPNSPKTIEMINLFNSR